MALTKWLDRARRAAEDHLPKEVLDAGRRLRDEVARRTGLEVPGMTVPSQATPSQDDAQPAADHGTTAERASEVIERFHHRGQDGLDPEDRAVVVYWTGAESEDLDAIRRVFETIDTPVREMDLRREPQTARQLAKITGVMVPPYVFINGRHWGARYEMEALAAQGDLLDVVANRLDAISDEAKRIGHVHETFSDDLSVDNIVERLRLGHILCVDDLDCWYEVDAQGVEQVFYQGAPRPASEIEAIATEIATAIEDGEIEAIWRLETEVQLN